MQTTSLGSRTQKSRHVRRPMVDGVTAVRSRCQVPDWGKGIVAICYQSPLIFQIALAELAPSLSSRRALPAKPRRPGRWLAFARGWLPGFTGPSPSTSLDKGQYSVVRCGSCDAVYCAKM